MVTNVDEIDIGIYLANMVLVLVLSVICNYRFKGFAGREISGEKVYLICSFIFMTCIMAFRATSVGVDTAPYSRIYTIIGESSSYFEALELAPLTAPIYVILCRILYCFSSDAQILTIVSSILVNIGLFVFIKKVSDDVAISTFSWLGLTLFYYSMNGNRQCLALILVLNAFVYFTKNILSKKGWLLFVIAVGIHSTALIALIAIIGIIVANKLKENRLVFIVSSIGSMFISLFFSSMVTLFTYLFPNYAMYTTGESNYSVLVSTGSGRIVLLYLFLLMICILWLICSKKGRIDPNQFHCKMFPAIVFGVVFGILNCKNELINRVLWFYLALFVSFLPSTIKKYKGYMQVAVKVGIIVILGTYSILSLLENQNGVVPYTAFWN